MTRDAVRLPLRAAVSPTPVDRVPEVARVGVWASPDTLPPATTLGAFRRAIVAVVSEPVQSSLMPAPLLTFDSGQDRPPNVSEVFKRRRQKITYGQVIWIRRVLYIGIHVKKYTELGVAVNFLLGL